MKRMMINATQSEELRVAIADGQKLLDLDIETPAHEQKKANIYKARITRVERSLEACFVDYGVARHGFLPFKEINPDALDMPAGEKKSGNIKDLLKEGQELIVQVEKEERGTKGAALSTYISLAGRYSVLMPNNPGGGGVSRRINGPERNDLRALIDQLTLPEEMGLIIRTAGMGREADELQWDIDYLVQLWAAIKTASAEHKAPLLIYQESNLFIRALRDYLRDDITEILVDDEGVYNKALEFMQMVMPHNLRKLKRYEGETPLFTRFQIESQIETAFAREVRLPSGGALVIDHTEALLSIDINSARATKGADIEETALQTNLEAADEISRQLKIRDLGGLVVIDFIDMSKRSSQRKVEDKLTAALKSDRARIQVGRISRFGLLEMSRQRMRPSLGDSSYLTCPRCQGSGNIRSVESLALSILRLLEEEALKDNTGQIQIQVPVQVANFMLNEKRHAIQVIEQRHDVQVLLLSNPGMDTPHYEIKRLRPTEVEDAPSYEQVTPIAQQLESSNSTQAVANRPKAIVDRIQPSAPAPMRKTAKAGWLQSLFAFFAGNDADSQNGRKSHRSTASASRAGQSSGASQADSSRPAGRGGRSDTRPVGKKTRSKKKTGKKSQVNQRRQGDPNDANRPDSGRQDTKGQDTDSASGRGQRRGKKVSKKTSTHADSRDSAAQQPAAAQNQPATSAENTTAESQEQKHSQSSSDQSRTGASAASSDATESKPRRRGKRGGRRRRSKQESTAQSGTNTQQQSGEDAAENKSQRPAAVDGNRAQTTNDNQSANAPANQANNEAGQATARNANDNAQAQSAGNRTTAKPADRPDKKVDANHTRNDAADNKPESAAQVKQSASSSGNAQNPSSPSTVSTQQPVADKSPSKAAGNEPNSRPVADTDHTAAAAIDKHPAKSTGTDKSSAASDASRAIPDGPKGLYVLPKTDAQADSKGQSD